MNYTEAKTYQNYNHMGTDKYSLVNTGALVQIIKENSSLDVFRYEEASTRKASREGLQNHLVRMRPLDITPTNGLFPEIVINNSYDKTRALKISLGFFRLVCSNGLIVGTTIDSFTSRHVNFDYEGLMKYVSEFPRLAEQGIEQVHRMQSYSFSQPEKINLARDVYMLKNDLNETTQQDDYEINRLLRARRYEDNEPNAFVTMNVIQENILRGRTGGYGKLRPVKAIDKTVKLNRFIWDRTVEMTRG